MNISIPPLTIGAVIAIVVLILAIVLVVVDQLDPTIGALLAALAVARLT